MKQIRFPAAKYTLGKHHAVKENGYSSVFSALVEELQKLFIDSCSVTFTMNVRRNFMQCCALSQVTICLGMLWLASGRHLWPVGSRVHGFTPRVGY